MLSVAQYIIYRTASACIPKWQRNKSPVVIVSKYIINSKLSALQIMKFGKNCITLWNCSLLFETKPVLKYNLRFAQFERKVCVNHTCNILFIFRDVVRIQKASTHWDTLRALGLSPIVLSLTWVRGSYGKLIFANTLSAKKCWALQNKNYQFIRFSLVHNLWGNVRKITLLTNIKLKLEKNLMFHIFFVPLKKKSVWLNFFCEKLMPNSSILRGGRYFKHSGGWGIH